ncbi:hypothetical protein [Streptomyces prunicolor]|uniref:hypothetical protein n=1 Tax=Streptomyces prunicolor TaxID=67348 RepID=UPI00035E7F6E|nr:hypothetical protein [Streptomyces prunicolor]
MDPLTPPEPAHFPVPAENALAPVAATTAPMPVPGIPAGRGCSACGAPAKVHWQRRPTCDELDEILRAETNRRVQALKLADVQKPAPVFPPLPNAVDTTRIVHACGAHAISLEAAALIHASCCTAPNEADLPGCDCTPEPRPVAPAEEEQGWELPAHWVTGGQ